MQDDAGWVERARAGDCKAWRDIYACHAAAVRRVVSGFGQLSRADLEDLVQDTFVTAFTSLHQLREPSHLRAWLLRIARTRALNRVRDGRAAQRASQVFAHDPAAGAQAPRGDDGALERNRRAAVVRELIEALPAGAEADTVRLFYVEGTLSASQIAEHMGVGKSTITMRLERFRARVKAQLAARLFETGGDLA